MANQSASQFQEEMAVATHGQMAEGLGAISPEEEQQMAMEFEEGQNQERNNSRIKQLSEAAKQKVKQKAVKSTEKAVLRFAGRAGLRSGIVWFFSTFGVAIAIICAILLAVAAIIAIMKYTCEQDQGIAGKVGRGVKIVAGTRVGKWLGVDSYDICGKLEFSGITATASLPEVPPEPVAGGNLGLVPISGVPVSVDLDAVKSQLKPCMLRRVQNIYDKAKTVGIDFLITSAYRPGAMTASGKPSAHARGEAVDIVIIPRGNLNDPDFVEAIRKLVSISRVEAFFPAKGDTLDEYHKPTENATGGHIHLEFNLAPNGGSYCQLPY